MLNDNMSELVERLGEVAGPVRMNNGSFSDLAHEAAASLTSLSAEVARKDAEIERLRVDADRWRALLRCARIRMFGSAGVNPKTGEREQYSNATQKMEKTSDGWVHFGAEFWSVYPGAENYDGTNEWGVHALTALADDVMLKERAALSAPKGDEHGE